MSARYLTSEQDAQLRRWEPIIVLQLKLACPSCGHKIGWQAKLMAPDQCKSCGVFLRSKNASS